MLADHLKRNTVNTHFPRLVRERVIVAIRLCLLSNEERRRLDSERPVEDIVALSCVDSLNADCLSRCCVGLALDLALDGGSRTESEVYCAFNIL
jgi:hypothetical protein